MWNKKGGLIFFPLMKVDVVEQGEGEEGSLYPNAITLIFK